MRRQVPHISSYLLISPHISSYLLTAPIETISKAFMESISVQLMQGLITARSSDRDSAVHTG
jgi:hypothetical protein